MDDDSNLSSPRDQINYFETYGNRTDTNLQKPGNLFTEKALDDGFRMVEYETYRLVKVL